MIRLIGGAFLQPTDTVCDVATSEVLIKYYIENVTVPAKGSVKCGLYRQHVCSSASAVVGDFDFTLRK